MLRRVVVLLVLAIFLIVGCRVVKYEDVKKVMISQVEAMENFSLAMEKAGSGKDAANAIEAYTEEMKILVPKMNEISKKYPELSSKESPVELKELTEKTEITSKKFGEALMKALMEYAKDPEVGKALEEMGEIIKGIEK